jgi:hypothetical protein
MNVLYTVTIPANAERLEKVVRSIEQSLEASALEPAVHIELARAASALLGLARTWVEGGATIAVHVEASEGAYEVVVQARRATGETCAMSARFTAKRA